MHKSLHALQPNILSGHRYFVTSLDVVEIGEGGLSRKGDAVSLFLFSDILEVCRRRSRAVLTSRSPASSTLGRSGFPKTYKHIVMVHLYDVKRVVELTSTEDSGQFAHQLCFHFLAFFPIGKSTGFEIIAVFIAMSVCLKKGLLKQLLLEMCEY